MGIFEFAVRNKLRFEFRGVISVEDLFDLNVRQLDSIFKKLNAQLKKAKEESLLSIKDKTDQELEVKIEIIKYIVESKLKENEQKLEAKEKKEKKQQLLDILSRKQNENLENKSEEEIKAMLENL